MKVLLCANTAWYLHNFRGSLIEVLIDKSYCVHCLAPADEYLHLLVKLGARYHHLNLSRTGMNPWQEVAVCLRLHQTLKAIGPDVVLSYTPKLNLYVGICNRLLKFRQVANISGLGELFEKKGVAVSLLRDTLYRVALGRASRIFFQNQVDFETLVHEKQLLPVSSCRRLPGSGVDIKRFRAESNRRHAGDHRRVFLMYGRFLPQKGFDLFLQAARKLRGIYGDRVEFRVMGGVDDAREESKALYERILKHRDAGHVHFHTWTDRVETVVADCDAVVLPTIYHEGVPRTLLEAMACGKPIVTTNWRGARDTVEVGRNGFLVKPGDLDSLVTAVRDIVEMPEDQLKEMGRESRRKAERDFDEQRVLDEYLEIIEEGDQRSEGKALEDSITLKGVPESTRRISEIRK